MLVLMIWPAFSLSVWADIRLPKIFSDSMVLQRQSEIPIWGMADPEEELVISVTGTHIEKKELKTVCDDQGRFHVKLPSLPVGGPYELEIVGASSTVRLRDVLVGDVWLCAGQSNMEMPVAATQQAESVGDQLPNDQLRLLTVEKIASPRPLEEFTGAVTWHPATKERADTFSAVGYYFGSRLQQSQSVPIGVINASWGGTLCEAWTSLEALKNSDDLQALYDFGQNNADSLQKQDQHGALFNGMIAPLTQFPIKGVVWYQGESNVGRGDQYSRLLPTMIRDWRNRFSSPQLPFLIVQLAPYQYPNQPPQALAEVWDAQLKTVRSLPGCGLVITTDLGSPDDIHPVTKLPVAERLSYWAVAQVYNDRQLIPAVPAETPRPATSPTAPAATAENPDTPETPNAATEPSNNAASSQATDASPDPDGTDETLPPNFPIPYASPLFRMIETQDNRIVVHFHAGLGLKSSDDQPLREFEIAGQDKVFHPAQATIVDQTVVVHSPEVEQPVAVRFAFRNIPDPNLVNGSDLPASPFRSDDFPLKSQGKEY